MTPLQTKALTGRRSGSRLVDELWRPLLRLPPPAAVISSNIGPDVELESLIVRHWMSPRPLFIRRLVSSCRSVLVHPWFVEQFRAVFGLHEAFAPEAERKKVLYMTRNPVSAAEAAAAGGSPAGGTGIINDSRGVINELEVLEGIRGVLSRRGHGEEVGPAIPHQSGY